MSTAEQKAASEAAETGFLTRETILGVDDIKTEVVDVPEWGGKVRVKGLNGTERDAWESSLVDKSGKKAKVNTENIRAKLVAATVVDSKGGLLFSVQDVKALGKKSSAALDRIFEVAQRLSKVSEEDIEELAGNSGSAPSGG